MTEETYPVASIREQTRTLRQHNLRHAAGTLLILAEQAYRAGCPDEAAEYEAKAAEYVERANV